MDHDPGERPVVFLVEEDDETRLVLKGNLRNYGFRVLVALDEEDALWRITGMASRPDLILLNLLGKTPEEVLQIGRRIREHGKYDGQTPLVVIAEKYGADLEGKDVHVSDNDWITYLEEPGQLKNLLRHLTTKTESK